MTYDVRDLQSRLQMLGYYRGRVDGIVGPKTEAAIIAFKVARGLRARAYVGPLTMAALVKASTALRPMDPPANQPPWLNELAAVLGWHEVRDNAALRAWLRTDGRALGDPAALPWCGDATETAILRALPSEPLVDDTRGNPYWARNWQTFGVPCGQVVGAAVPMVRQGGGHIAFLLGVSPDRRKIRCRGGNQSNMVSDAWFDTGAVLDYRWPRTWPAAFQTPAPVMDPGGAILPVSVV